MFFVYKQKKIEVVIFVDSLASVGRGNFELDSSKETGVKNTKVIDFMEGKRFAEIAKKSKQIHTFRYYLKNKDVNEKNGILSNKALHRDIQLVSLEQFRTALD